MAMTAEVKDELSRLVVNSVSARRAEVALRFALEEARLRGTTLRVVHAYIHTGANDVPRRFYAYLAGAIVLMIWNSKCHSPALRFKPTAASGTTWPSISTSCEPVPRMPSVCHVSRIFTCGDTCRMSAMRRTFAASCWALHQASNASPPAWARAPAARLFGETGLR